MNNSLQRTTVLKSNSFAKRVNKTLKLLLLLALVVMGGKSWGQVNVNGTIGLSEYGTHVNGSNQQSSTTGTWYMTWDATNLYVGISGTNTAEGAVLYLDKNPLVLVNGGTNANGNLTGFNNYDGSSFANLQFRADLVVYFKDSYREYRTADGAGGWSAPTASFGSYASASGTREVAIPWSAIGGMPAAFNWFGYVAYSGGGAYASVPTENPGSGGGLIIGASARWDRYYTVSSTTIGSSTLPFSRNSYCFTSASDVTNFGAISCFDFTMNSSGRFVSRTGATAGNWSIGGNLVVGNGTVYLGSGGTNGSYGATNVTGILNLLGGTFDMDQTTGAASITGNVSIASGATLKLSGNSFGGGDIKLAGNWSNSGTFTPNSRTVTFNSAIANQTLTGSNTFYNLTVNNTVLLGNVTASGSLTVNALMRVQAGTFTSATQYNDVQIDNGATLTLSGDIDVSGNWSNSGTFNANGFAVKFNKASGTQTVDNGSSSFYTLHHTGAGTLQLVNNNVTTSIGFYNYAGTLDLNTKTMNLGTSWWNDGTAAIGNGTVNFTSSANIEGSTVTQFNNVSTANAINLTALQDFKVTGNWTNNGTLVYNTSTATFNGSGAQTIGGFGTNSFYNLVLNNAAGANITGADVSIYGTMTLTSGNLNIGTQSLLFDPAASVTGNPGFSASNMIIADGGGLVAKFGNNSTQATFTFPVGDNTGTVEYSPITLQYNLGIFSGGYSYVRLSNTHNTNDNSTTNYLNRYWTVNQSGYSSFTCNVSAYYVDADIVGTEAGIVTGKWNGVLPWIKYAVADVANNKLLASNVSSFSDFAGISNPVITINEGPTASVCLNGSLTLNTTASGAPALSYQWSGGLGTASTATPPTTSAGSTVYTVTVTDGNGITATVSINVTVNETIAGIANNSGTTLISCANPSISLTATGGGTYLWSSGATPTNASQSFNTAGTYTVTVTNNGCVSSTSVTLTGSIPGPNGDYQSFQSGNWNDPATWNVWNGCSWVAAGAAPSSADNVITILGAHTVTVNSAVTADQVVVNGTLTVSANTLTIANGAGTDLDVNGALNLSGGTIDGAGDVSVNTGGTFTWNGGNLSGTLFTIQSGATGSISAATQHYINSTQSFVNNGTINWNNGNVLMNATSNFTNNGTINLLNDNSIIHNGGTPAFTNGAAGVITKSAGTGTSFFGNSSSITINNSGLINLQSGYININANGTYASGGSINVTSGKAFAFTGGTQAINSGFSFTSVGGPGIITFASTTTLVSGVNYDATLVTYLNGGTANWSKTGLVIDNLYIISNATFNNTGSLTVSNSFDFQGGSINGAGSVTVSGTGTFATGPKSFTGGQQFINNGTITWSGGIVYLANTGTSFTNNGMLDIVNDVTLSHSVGGNPVFINSATGIVKKSAGAGTTIFGNVPSVVFNNNGQFNVESGTITTATTGTYNSGSSINITAGKALAFTGGTETFNSGCSFTSVGAGGYITFAATSSLVTGVNYDATLLTYLNGGTANWSHSALTINNLTLINPTLNNTGGITVPTTFDWQGGSINGVGSVTVSNTGTFSTGSAKYITNGQSFTNNGMITWSAGNFFIADNGTLFTNNGTLDMTADVVLSHSTGGNPVFTNSATGIVKKSGGAGTTIFGNVPSVVFNNNGQFNVESGTVITGSTLTNNSGGSINVTSGKSLAFTGGSETFNSGCSLNSIGGPGYISFNAASSLVTGVTYDPTLITTLNGGTANWSHSALTINNLTLINPTLNNTGSITVPTTFDWQGGSINNAGTVLISGTGTFSTGSGKYVTNGQSVTNNGSINWSGGNLFLADNGTSFINNGTLDMTADVVLSHSTGGNPVFTNSATGIIVKSGGGGTSTFGNVTNIVFNNNGQFNVQTGTVAMNAGGTRAGSFNVSSGATLTSTNAFAFTGTTFTNNGTVSDNISFNNSGTYKGNGLYNGSLFTNAAIGTVSPGNSPGCQTFSNGWTTAGSTDIEINGTTACTQFDRISVTGTATLGGILNVTIGYAAASGDQITFINATTLSGIFANVNVPANWYINYNYPATGQVTFRYCVTPTLNTSVNNISCVPNNPTGSATVTPTLGTAPYTYLWNDGAAQTTATATGLTAGVYTVTVYANGGCSSSTSVTISGNTTAPAAGITNNSGTTEITCIQTSISVTATGSGQGTLSYAWSGGATPATAANLFTTAGTYIVTVTDDANGCTSSASITITSNITPPTAGITNNSGTTVISCSPTSISATATGSGQGVLSYAWSGGATPATAANSLTVAGTYTVTVTDAANGCTASASITITGSVPGPNGDYQSFQTGNWNDPATWNVWNGCSWVAAGAAPSSADNVITILSGHVVTVTAAVTIDQTTVDAGGTLQMNAGVILNNGVGNDLTVIGTIICKTNVVSGAGFFALNADATIKCGNASGLDGSITAPRSLSTSANYVFNGTGNQNTGGMPSTVKTFTCANTGSSGNNLVNLWQSQVNLTSPVNSLVLESGFLTVQTQGFKLPANGQIVSTGGDFDAPYYGGYTDCSNGGTVTVTGNVSFKEVDLYNNTNLVLSSGSKIYDKLYLQANAGTVTGSPQYMTGSQLFYGPNGTYTRGDEWNGTSGNGYPYSVRIVNTTLLMNNGQPTAPVAMEDMLTMNSGTLDMTGMQAPLTIGWLNGGNIVLSNLAGGDINVNGPFWNCNGLTANGRKVTFQNTGSISVSGSGTGANFFDLDINKAGGVNLNSDITINGTLNLNTGIVTTGSNKVNISNTGSVARVNGWINGKLSKHVGTGAAISRTFEIGDASNYTPSAVAFSNVTTAGTLLATTTSGDHVNIGTSGLNAAKTVNRTWSLTNTGIDFTTGSNTAAVTLNWVAGDEDGGLTYPNLNVGKFDAPSTWAIIPVASQSGTSITTTSSINSFSDFQVGESACIIPSLSTSQTNITCLVPTGSATVNPTGGSSPYTYLWNDGLAQTTQTATGLAAGTYTVTVTATGGCTATVSVTITGNTTAPSLSALTGGTLTCTTTSINVTASATGQGALSYLWSGGSSPATAANSFSTAGTYTVTVTDAANGCTSSESVTIGSNTTAPSIAPLTGGTLTCTTTSINVTASATGQGALSYAWSGGVTPATDANSFSTAGTYTVTVTDAANGCTSSASVTIISNTTAPSIAPLTGGTLTCTATSINVTASGSGQGALSYAWSGGSSPATAANSFSTAGTYTVTVTDAANGCTSSASVTIGSNTTAPSIAPLTGGILTCTTTSINVTASGSGQGALSYAWSGGSSPTTAANSFSTAGTYTVTVTDAANGCTSSASVTIGSNTTAPSLSALTGGTLTCTTTSINVTASGSGQGALSYAWSGGSSPATAANSFSTAGTYTVTVTDAANGCTSSESVTIGSNTTAPSLSALTGGTLTCTTTSINVTASATGQGALSYLWSGGSSPATAANSFSTAGTYTVTVTDAANGCTSSASVTIGSNTTAPSIAPLTGGTLTCTATSINVTASATGQGALSYLWSGGSSPATAANSFSTAGTYTVTVTDAANGCTSSASVTIISNTTAPSIAPLTGGTLTCTATSINVTASATGQGALSYAWSGGATPATDANSFSTAGTYTVTVTDAANGCTSSASVTIISNTTAPSIAPLTGGSLTCTATSINVTASATGQGALSYAWSGGSSPATAANSFSTAGTYTVTVTDAANGCSSSESVTIGSNTTAPSIAPLTGGTLTCTTTSINVTASGSGQGALSYAWSGGSSPTTAANSFSTAGTYTVTVTDAANGCTSSASVTIGSNTTAPAAAISPSAVSLTCSTTSITLTASGGGTFVWDDNSISAARIVSAAGTYIVTVTDGTNGCTASASIAITSNLTVPEVSAFASPATVCAGSSTVLTAIGADTYSWMPGGLSGTFVSVSPVTATTYTVTGTSANGCSATTTVMVAVNSLFNATATTTNVACKGNSTGSIILSVTGGNNVSFLWNNGSVTPNRTNLFAGTYTVTISDNCKTQVLSFTITEPAAGLLLTGTKKNPKCSIGATGSATVAVSGGVSPYSFLWSNGQTNATATGLLGTAYTVTVSSAGGCTRSMTFILVAPNAVSVALTATNPTIALPTSGQIVALASGGTPNYLYLWNTAPLKTTATITGLAAGTYTVKVTDKNGCTVTSSVTLTNTARLSNMAQEPLVAVNVLPNPSDGLFNVKAIAIAESEATLQLIDLTGRTVITEQMPLIAGNNSMMLDAQALPKGIYLLRFTVADKIQTIRLVSQ